MLQYSQPNVVNVFTDASTIEDKSCSAYIVIQNDKYLWSDAVIHREVTNNFGELYAIMMALNYICHVVNSMRYSNPNGLSQMKFNIFSDSEYALNCLTKWIFSWYKYTARFEADTSCLPTLMKKKPYGKKIKPSKVANQDVIMQCVGILLTINFPISMLHVKAHKTNTKVADVIRSCINLNKDRTKYSMEELTIGNFKSMIHWNAQVDKLANTTLQSRLLQPNIEQLPTPSWVVQFYPTPEQLQLYRTLIQ